DAGGRTHTAASAPPNRGLDRGVCRRWNSLARTRLMARTHAAERNWPERLEMAFIDRPRPRRLRVAHEAGAESGRGAAAARLGDRLAAMSSLRACLAVLMAMALFLSGAEAREAPDSFADL